ncbi:hypothetical protein GCM10023340_36200 [Nocardioides marinquilinus]|uniref:Uncharacterized protein n=1 Tax=Nocardioides marinquilinus TaxID=1210400 RepID=A0ABP9Q2J0_9ACTN
MRRRGEPGAQPDAAPVLPAEVPEPDAAPSPPDDRPAAVFAGVLDGRHLWVAVAERPGHLALRDADAGRVVGDPAPAADAQAGWLDARLDLAAAFGPDGADRLAVVLVPPGTAAPQPVRTPPLDVLPGAGAVPEADEGPRYVLDREPDGALVVRRKPRSDGARLQALSDVGPHSARLTLAEVGADDALALRRAGTTLATWPLVADGAGGGDVVLDVRDLDPAAWSEPGRAVLVLAGSGAPVRRRRNDLDPATAVGMPELVVDPDGPTGAGEAGDAGDAGQSLAAGGRLRLRWGSSGRLVARVMPTEEHETDGGAGDDGEGDES